MRNRIPKVLVVAALAGAMACDSGSGPAHDHGGGDVCGHVDDAGGVFLQDSHSSETLCSQSGTSVEGHVPCHVNTLLHGVQVRFRDLQGEVIPLAEDCAINGLTWTLDDPGVVEITQDPGLRWYVNFKGKALGATTVRFQLHHDDHVHFESLPLPIQVTP